MTNWVEYWDKDKLLVTITGSYVPRKGDWVKIKLKSKYKMMKVIDVIHTIDKIGFIKEKFAVIVR